MASSTSFSVIVISLKFLSSQSGMLVSFSFLNTLEKYSLRVFAVLDVRTPFGMRSLDTNILAHLTEGSHDELIGWEASRCPSVRVSVSQSVCVSVLTLSNMYISETKRPIAIKFYLKHHLGVEKAASGFCPV